MYSATSKIPYQVKLSVGVTDRYIKNRKDKGYLISYWLLFAVYLSACKEIRRFFPPVSDHVELIGH